MNLGHFKNMMKQVAELAVKEEISYDQALVMFRQAIAAAAVAKHGDRGAAARKLGLSRNAVWALGRGGWGRKRRSVACDI